MTPSKHRSVAKPLLLVFAVPLALVLIIAVTCILARPGELPDEDVEAGRLIRLTKTSGTEKNPAWSPDGTKIAYECYSDGDVMTDSQVKNRTISSILVSSICVMNVDGSDRKRLTEELYNQHSPAWSPDGTKIAFSAGDGIHIINADGSPVTDGPISGGSPTWSPDGQRIAFSTKGDIYVINTDGTGLQQVTDDRFPDWEPAWSPDGKRIAFTSREKETSAIYLIDLDSSQRTLLYGDPRNEDSPVESPAWSPDGKTFSLLKMLVHYILAPSIK